MPSDDEEAMPPKGKTLLTKEEINLISWWISNGALKDQKVSQASKDVVIKNILNRLFTKESPNILLSLKIEPVSETNIKKAVEKQFIVLPLFQNNSFLEISPMENLRDSFATENLKSLISLSENIAILNLQKTNIKDQDLKIVAEMKHLFKLHLENTMITDNAMDHLKSLSHLEYLNVYNTAITDNGIKKLSALKNLKVLYVYQTKVSDAGKQELLKNIPGQVIYD